MRVIGLHAENVKRIRVVDITPSDDVVVIAGKNGSGKSSTIDAVSWALGGAALFTDQPDPIRHGQRTASVTVTLGDGDRAEVIVTRTWSKDGPSKLDVRGADGSKFKTPQSALDALIAERAHDPLAFDRADAKTQRKILLGLVDLPFDLDELDRRRQAIFDQRTDANREHKRLVGALSSLPVPARDPGPLVDIAEATTALRTGLDLKAANDAKRSYLQRAEQVVAAGRERVAAIERQLAEARAALAADEAVQAALEEEIAFLDDDPDIDALQAAVADADRRKDEQRRAAEYSQRTAEVEQAKTAADALTAQLEAIDAEKLAGLQAAAMPIPGLSISDEAVLFNGVPFAQASGAERLRVSLAIVMAANPELRVCYIKDGSLLDDDSLQLVREMAAANDYQIWLEMVGDHHDGIVIEDGAIVEVRP